MVWSKYDSCWRFNYRTISKFIQLYNEYNDEFNDVINGICHDHDIQIFNGTYR